MNEERIVDLVHKGFLEKEIRVYTQDRAFKGVWYAVDMSDKTIELEAENYRFIIDFTKIVAIGYKEVE